MPRFRLWIWVAVALSAVVAASVLIQAVNNLLWQLSYLLPAWLVGPVTLLLIGGGVLLVARFAGPWLLAWRRRPPPAAPPPPAVAPGNRQEAAERQLQAIDQVLERVRDDVARAALRQERERVEAELARGDLELVVFGTGSTGKTSLICALLDEVVGEVGAAMGSTGDCRVYRLRLKGLRRGLRLVDTPGILEAGTDGRQREITARERAARADLLLFVVDGDLRAAELEVFEALASLGKRLLLVLNKCDLRGQEEERRLLDLLRRRCSGRLADDDVLAASAAPQSVPLPGGRPHQPLPEIDALLRRIATVLHQDGEELLADNILLQSRRLSEASRALLSAQSRSDGERIVDRYMWIGAGVLVVTPMPVVDLLGTAAVNAQMVVELGKVYGGHPHAGGRPGSGPFGGAHAGGAWRYQWRAGPDRLRPHPQPAGADREQGGAGGERGLVHPHRRPELPHLLRAGAGLGRWRHAGGGAPPLRPQPPRGCPQGLPAGGHQPGGGAVAAAERSPTAATPRASGGGGSRGPRASSTVISPR